MFSKTGESTILKMIKENGQGVEVTEICEFCGRPYEGKSCKCREVVTNGPAEKTR